MFLKCDPYRVWCSIFYSKVVNCILLRSLFVFVKGRGTCGSRERNVKIWIDFRKSPRLSLTSPLSQEREKSSRPVFTMCGEPWCHLSKSLINMLSLICNGFLITSYMSKHRSWFYGSWTYLCNQCLSPLTLRVQIPLRYSIQHYVIKFVSDLLQVGGFLQACRFPPPIKPTSTK